MDGPAQPAPRPVTLRIVPGSDPIEGRVSAADGSEHPFHGWLELSAVIEEVRTRDVTVTEPGSSGPAAS